MSNIDVAKLTILWDLDSWIKPSNLPHYSLFKRIKDIKITWLSEDVGEVTLPNEDVNYMHHKGYYYFLQKQDPLDEDRKIFNYLIIKDFWTSLLLRKIKIKGNLIKTNDKQLLWDNLDSTIPMIDNLSGIARFNMLETKISPEELMNNVEIALSDKKFEVKVITKESYNNFINGIRRLFGYSVSTSNYIGIFARLKLTKISSWKQKILDDLNEWLEDNRFNLVIGGVTNQQMATAAPHIANKIRKDRWEAKTTNGEKNTDKTIKTIYVENVTGILSGLKETGYVEKIDISTIADIENMSILDVYERLAVDLFESGETPKLSNFIYLRPKLYSIKTIDDHRTKQIIDNLHLSNNIYKSDIYWSATSQTQREAYRTFYLEDWSDGKYFSKANDLKIIEKRMGFIPGVFSTEFKKTLIRGLYTKDYATTFSFVNGLNFELNDNTKKYINAYKPIDPITTIPKLSTFKNIGEDLTSYIEYNNFDDGVVDKKTADKKDVILKEHEKLNRWKLTSETTVKKDIVKDKSHIFIYPGTLLVNNISYGFYEFPMDTIEKNNNIDTFNMNPTGQEIDLSNEIVFITEPFDVSTSSFKNTQIGPGYGIRYCINKEYDIEPSENITKFVNDGKTNTTTVSIFKRLLEKKQKLNAQKIDIEVKNFIDIAKTLYGPWMKITKMDITLGSKTLKKWFFEEWDKSDWGGQSYDKLGRTFHNKYNKHIGPLKDLIESYWPKKDGLYILPKEWYLTGYEHNLFFKFDDYILFIAQYYTSAHVYGWAGNLKPHVEKLFRTVDVAPYEEFYRIQDTIDKFDHSASGPSAKEKLKNTKEGGLMDKLIHEIYKSELSDIKTEKTGEDYYIEWWEFKKDKISYFDLKGTNYYLVYKCGKTEKDKPIIELIFKDNIQIKTHTLNSIEFKNTFYNDNLVFNINQINSIYLKGKTFPLKTKFNFKSETFKFHEFYWTDLKNSKITMFNTFVYKIITKHERIEGNLKVSKPTIDTTKFDAYQYEKLLIDQQSAATKMIENELLTRENNRRANVTLQNKIDDYEAHSGVTGGMKLGLNLATSAARAAGGAVFGGGLIQSAKKAGIMSASGFKLSMAVGGITQSASSIMEHIEQTEKKARDLTNTQIGTINAAELSAFKSQNAHKYAEYNEMLAFSKSTNLINYAEINDTEEMEDYLTKIGATSLHLVTIYPVPHEIEEITKIYDKYGIDVDIKNFEIDLSNIPIKEDHYILKMGEIDSITGTKNPNEIEYIKTMLESGVKVKHMEELDEGFIEVEEVVVDEELQQELIPKILYDECKADLAKLSSDYEDETAKNIKLDKDNKAAVQAIIAERDKVKKELEEAKKKEEIAEKLRNSYNQMTDQKIKLEQEKERLERELEEAKSKQHCEDTVELRNNYDTLADAKKKLDAELEKVKDQLYKTNEQMKECQTKLKEHTKTDEEIAREYKVEREQKIKGYVDRILELVNLIKNQWRNIARAVEGDRLTLVIHYNKKGNRWQKYGNNLTVTSNALGLETLDKSDFGGQGYNKYEIAFLNEGSFSIGSNVYMPWLEYIAPEVGCGSTTTKISVNIYSGSYFGFKITFPCKNGFDIVSNSKPGIFLYYITAVINHFAEWEELATKIDNFCQTDGDIVNEKYSYLNTSDIAKRMFRQFTYIIDTNSKQV